MYKNVAGQKLTLLAIDTSLNAPKTGDAANITAYISGDDGVVTILGDVTATEKSATHAKGLYDFDLTQAETNYNKIVFSGISSTNNIQIVPVREWPIQVPVAGIGARTVTLLITDLVAVPLQSAVVRVTKGLLSYVLTSDVNGLVTFNIDDGTWVVAITLANYSFSGAPLSVSADIASQNYQLTPLSLVPSNPGLTTGYTYTYDVNGIIQSGVNMSIIMDAVSGFGIANNKSIRTVSSDVNGLVQFTNLFKGQQYSLRRGNKGGLEILIPSNAGGTYLLPSVLGD